METSYPIVLTSTKEGYTAYIPDFNLTAKGEKQSDAIDAAKKAVYLWALSEENAEKSIPKPFSANGIVAKPGRIVTLIRLTLDFFSLRAIIQPPQFQHWELLHIYREGILCECSLSFVLRSH